MSRGSHALPRKVCVLAVAGLGIVSTTECRQGTSTTAKAPAAPAGQPAHPPPPGFGAVEQATDGTKPAAQLVESFDGLGAGFAGPQGTFHNHSVADNSVAVGPNHIVETVNTQMAIFTRKGKLFDTTGKVLYGPVNTNNVFKGFGGECEAHNGGDAVVRYDQLADRWLIVMPRRELPRPDQPPPWEADGRASVSPPGRPGQPAPAAPLFQPPPAAPGDTIVPPPHHEPAPANSPFAMCYAVSATGDPMGSYYRYEFLRPYFPDYPRPAIWSDGYYVPSSSSDNRIADTVVTRKHACVLDRSKMLQGQPATEQCVIIENANFLNNADIDGTALPPAGAPNIMLADGGTQIDSIREDDGIYVWQFHVDWKDPSKTTVIGPQKIAVAHYHYLCEGQESSCVPQPGTDERLDSQGDKLMQRTVYRNVHGHESILAVHSVSTAAGGGGVRWYEFRVAKDRTLKLYQQGTYAPGGFYRWMPSAAMDKNGSIGIGYSFGGPPNFVGQRFAGRVEDDPLGQLTLQETVLATGEAAQTHSLRWEDYAQTAIDPRDDCTIWYVGDYLKKGLEYYTSKIGAFKLPGC